MPRRLLLLLAALGGLLAPSLAVAAGPTDPGAPPPLVVQPPRAVLKGVPADFYGTWFDGMSLPSSYNKAAFEEQASIGVRVVRQYVWWERIETAPGVYDWAKLDEVVGDAYAARVRILPTLLYTPSFHSSKPAGSTSSSQFPPADPATLATFATAMIQRYGPRGDFWCSEPALPCNDRYAIRMWEVWNEPDYPSWWKGRPNANEYAALLTTVSAAIKQADPGAEVILGALTGAQAAAPDGFLEQLYRAGVGRSFDTIAFNPYTVSVLEMIQRIRDVRKIASKYGDGTKPFRILEYGWATGGTSSLTSVTPACQAALLYAGTKRLTEVRKSLNIRSIVQFQWQDAPAQDPPSNAWPHYAGVKFFDGSPKPSRDALAAAIAGRPTPDGAALSVCPFERRAVAG